MEDMRQENSEDASRAAVHVLVVVLDLMSVAGKQS